jgi:hypothetical protein
MVVMKLQAFTSSKSENKCSNKTGKWDKAKVLDEVRCTEKGS